MFMDTIKALKQRYEEERKGATGSNVDKLTDKALDEASAQYRQLAASGSLEDVAAALALFVGTVLGTAGGFGPGYEEAEALADRAMELVA